MAKPEIYYFAFVKKRNINRLLGTSYHPPGLTHHFSAHSDLLHRLSLHSILAGEFFSAFRSILDYLCLELESNDEIFYSRIPYGFPNDPLAPLTLRNYFPYSVSRSFLRYRLQYQAALFKSLSLLHLEQEEQNEIWEELQDLINFFCLIAQMHTSNRYVLLLIQSSTELHFHRSLPAPSGGNQKPFGQP